MGQIGERARRAVAETSVDDGEAHIRVSISAGGTTYRDASDSPEALLAAADAALYQAKESGRDRVVMG